MDGDVKKLAVCEECGSCTTCRDGVCAGHAGMGILGGRRGMVRPFLVIALLSLALWATVSAISGIMGLRYIGSGIPATNTLNVTGSGKVYAVADTATFSFTVSETGKDVGTANQAVTKKMDDIIAYLKEAGVEDRDIQTTDYSANPKYDDTPCPADGTRPCTSFGTIVGYTVSETVTIKVRKTDDAGTILSNIGNRGVSNVSGLSFTVDDKEMLQNQARDKAIMEAQGKAEVLAKGLGVELVRVVGFYENADMPYYGRGEDSMMKASVAPTNIQVGENTILSNVTVTYEIR
jgi:uncharacterized protein YggE